MKSWRDGSGRIHEGRCLESENDFDVIECASCAYKHVIPIPTQDELEAIYRHDYYRTEKPFYIERYLEDKEWWDGVYDQRYRFLERNLPVSRRRILDIGSGPGLFLLKGRERGWVVKGMEPSAQAAAYSRDTLNLDITESYLDPRTAKDLGRFDVINLGEVLEHLPDPAAMLGLVHDLLEPGGLLCVIVPNDFNPLQRILRERSGFLPWWVAPPHHLNYFDFPSLAALVTHSGFEVIHQEATFPIDMFLLMGENYVDQPELGRACHAKRKRFDLALQRGDDDLHAAWSKALAGLGLGREIVLFARKPDHA